MNKIALALLLSLACSSAVFAQSATTVSVNTSTTDLDLDNAEITDLGNERTQLQLRAGVGLGKLTSGSVTSDAKSGTNFAATVDLPVAPGSSFNTGLNFVQKGASLSGTDFRVNYLVIPVQMKANFGYPRAFRWNLGLGPYVGIKTASYNSAGGNIDGIASYDLGGRASLGFEVPLQPRTAILVGADYDVGVKTIIESARTSTLLISAGIGIEI